MTAAPPQVDPRWHDQGLRLVAALYSLVRAAGLYDLNNRALEKPALALHEAIAFFLEVLDGPFVCASLDGQIFIGPVKVTIPDNRYHLVGDLEVLLAERQLSGVGFRTTPTVEALKVFAHVLRNYRSTQPEEEPAGLTEALRTAAIDGIGLVPRLQAGGSGNFGAASEGAAPEIEATLSYAKAVSAFSQLLADPVGPERISQSHLRRIVQNFADASPETLDHLIGLSEVSKEDLGARAVADTCIVVVALGRTLGLDRSALSDLGMAALVDGRLLGAGTAEPAGNSHVALRELLSESRWSTSLLNRVLAVAQSTQPVRGSGGLPPQYALARVYRAARDFVLLTYGVSLDQGPLGTKLTPLEALTQLIQAPPNLYDAVVIAHLVRVVGLYPVGTLVLLDDGREAFVVGRDGHERMFVRYREGPGRLGDQALLADTEHITGVMSRVDPDERAAALLGDEGKEHLQRLAEQAVSGAALGRVGLHRVTVRKRPKE